MDNDLLKQNCEGLAINTQFFFRSHNLSNRLEYCKFYENEQITNTLIGQVHAKML